MIAKRSTFVATAYASRISQPFMYPRNALSLGTVQAQMFSNPSEGYEINDVLVSALDRMQMPHADRDWCVVLDDASGRSLVGVFIRAWA